MRSDPVLWIASAMVGSLVLAANLTSVALVFLVRDDLGGSASVFGLIEACWTGAMLLGGWLAARRDRGDAALGRMLIAYHLGTALVVMLGGLAPAYGWLFPLWFIGGAINGAENNLLGVLAARRVPEAVRGRYFARLGAIVNAANVGGFLLGGLLLTRVGPGPLIFGGGLAGLAVIAALAPPMWRATRGPSRPPSGEPGGQAGRLSGERAGPAGDRVAGRASSPEQLRGHLPAGLGAVVAAEPTGKAHHDADAPTVAGRHAGHVPEAVVALQPSVLDRGAPGHPGW
jgi:MFS family permease